MIFRLTSIGNSDKNKGGCEPLGELKWESLKLIKKKKIRF